MGFDRADPHIAAGMAWLAAHQEMDGTWEETYVPGARPAKDTTARRAEQLWISLAVCRVFKRFGEYVVTG